MFFGAIEKSILFIGGGVVFVAILLVAIILIVKRYKKQDTTSNIADDNIAKIVDEQAKKKKEANKLDNNPSQSICESPCVKKDETNEINNKEIENTKQTSKQNNINLNEEVITKSMPNETKKNSTKKDPPAKDATKKEEQQVNTKTEEEDVIIVKDEATKTDIRYRVIYDRESKTWVIKKDMAKRIIRRVKTKEEALKIAKELSRNQDTSLVVHKKDGKFQKK